MDGEDVHVQAVGVPPYPATASHASSDCCSRPARAPARDTTLRYVRGDAAQPRRDGPAIIAHVVNDSAGTGVAAALS